MERGGYCSRGSTGGRGGYGGRGGGGGGRGGGYADVVYGPGGRGVAVEAVTVAVEVTTVNRRNRISSGVAVAGLPMNNIKLYVKSVFITDNCEEFIPEDFRFVKGFVDFHNLPLDTSLEMLQENNVVMPFRENLEQKCIEMLKEIAQNKNDHTK